MSERSAEDLLREARVVVQRGPFALAAWDPGAFDEVARGELKLPDADETLEELEAILQGLECRNTFFACNHASNYLPITGRLPNQKEEMLAAVRAARAGDIELKPEWLRGL